MEGELHSESHEHNEHAHHEHSHAEHAVHHAEHSHAHATKANMISGARSWAIENLPILLVYLLIALVLFWPITANIASTTVNGFGDLYQNLWGLWWVGYATFTLHTSIYFTPLLYYPIGASLVTQTLSPLAAYIMLPFQAGGLVLEYNALFFVDFMLCGFFMYLLANYLFKNKYAAFVAGIIFAYSPMHLTHALFGQSNWNSVQFLPLFILFFLMMIREKKLLYSFAAAVSFVFIMFFGDPEQGIMTAVLALIILLYYIIRPKRRPDILSLGFAKSLGAMVLLLLVVGSPFLIPIFTAVSGGVLSTANELSGLQYNIIWSNPLASFLLPNPSNNLIGGISSAFPNVYLVDQSERVAYLGYIAIILALIGLWSDFKKERLHNTFIWLAIAAIFAWLSIGPYLQIGSPQSASLPGIYYLYRLIPMLNLIREPGRFDLIVTMALALLAAFGAKSVIERLSASKAGAKSFALYATAVLSLLIILEYYGAPLGGPSFQSVTMPVGYTQIGQFPANVSMLFLPSLPLSTNHPNLYAGLAMYYQTAFQKPMISGYTSRINSTQELPELSIPLSVSSSYLLSGYGFIYPSPINENSTKVTLFWLKNYNTAFVSILRSAYNQSQLVQLYSYMRSVFGHEAYNDNSSIIFETSNAIQNLNLSSSIIAYPSIGAGSGSWIPGFALCQSQSSCNATFSSIFWGSTVRAIDIWSPKAQNVRMVMLASSYQQDSPLYLYLNPVATSTVPSPVATLVLSPGAMRTFGANLTLNSGRNELFFIAPNSTADPSDPYINFGIENITITPK
ncbi:MAG: hypothetical protein KGH59_03105 [Candidatus Micrarchaeota archaeon]|nr:hypothetical protein [Candidatus Micrarchaeota archaeon]